MQSFIVASFNAQSVKSKEMACKRCEISTFIKDNCVYLFFVTETWLSAQGDKAKSVELAPSGYGVIAFPRQKRSRGGGIATVSKSTLCSNITFKTNFDFTRTTFDVVQSSILHSTTHYIFSVCTALHQTDETILLTLCLLYSCLTFSITYATSQDLFVLLVIRITTLTIHYNH